MRRIIYSLRQAADELGVSLYYAEKHLGRPLPRSNDSEMRYYPSSAVEELRYRLNPTAIQTVLSPRNIERIKREGIL